MSKRILIIGGSGLLAVNWALTRRDYDEIILGLHDRQISIAGTKGSKLDLTSYDAVVRSIDQIQPDVLIHTAGLTSVEACERNPRLAKYVNIDLASSVAMACSALGIPMVHISTDHLFSGEVEMVCEETPPRPLNIYASTKAEAEVRVLENHPSALVIRTNFYGWGPSYRPSFSDQIINTLRFGKELSLFEDVYYTPILSEVLVQAVHELIENKASKIYQVVGDDRISKYAFGISIAKHFGLDKGLIKGIKMADKPDLVKRPQNMSLSNKKTVLKIQQSIGGVDQHLKRLLEQEASGFINEIIKL